MAEIEEPIKRGNYWTNIIAASTGESVNFEEVDEWVDGSAMDDSKVDGVIYRKLPDSVGGGYVKRVFDGYINLRWWGISGDGETDYTTRINTAFIYARRARVGIQIDPGVYIISSPINLNGTSGVIVNGYSATFKQAEQTSVNQLIAVFNSTDITINGLTFDGNYLNETPPTEPGSPDGWVGIYIAGNSRNVLINGCKFYQIQTKCVSINVAQNVTIRNCYFNESQYHDGIYIWGDSGVTKDILVEGCIFQNMARSGVFPDGAVKNVTVSNCEFRRDLEYPFGVGTSSGVRTRAGMNNLTITGNRFQENITRSVWLRATSGNIIITNNQMISPIRSAISIEAVSGDPASSYVIDNLIITGNNILTAGTVNGDTYIAIRNNAADSSSFCRNMIVSNNLLSEEGSRAINIEGIYVNNAVGGQVDSLKIENNILVSTPRDAIRISGGTSGSLSNVHISGNQVTSAGRRSIYVTDTSVIKIDGNTCKSSGIAPIYVEGDDYRIFNNYIVDCAGPGSLGGSSGTAYDNVLIDTPIPDWVILAGSVNVGEDVDTRLFSFGEYHAVDSGDTPDDLLSGRGTYHSSLEGTPVNASIPLWYIEARRIYSDVPPRYYQTAFGVQYTTGTWDRWTRVYNSSSEDWSPWIRDRVQQVAASADTAAAVGVEYDQGEVQAIITELRDLKTKMRAVGLLDT